MIGSVTVPEKEMFHQKKASTRNLPKNCMKLD